MANVLGNYNPLFYAQEALIQLWANMGMARTVHMGYDAERSSFNKGDTITIRRPTKFTVQDAPSTAQDLNPDTVNLVLNFWKEVKFKVSDKEYSFTGQQIIDEHINPAALELADFVDVTLNGLYKDIPWFHDLQSTPDQDDIVDTRKILSDNKVPLRDMANMHYQMGGAMTAAMLKIPAFSQDQGAGPAGVATQISGFLGRKYGMNTFENQNVPSHTKGTASATTLAAVGAYAAGVSTMTIDAGSVTGTLVPGDTFVIAGNTQRYAVTNTTTASTNVFTGVTFTPALVAAVSDNDVVTVSLDDHVANLAYHRNAFALAFGKLPDLSNFDNNLGAQVAVVQDPITGLAVRSRIYYVGNSSEIHVALDILFGVKTLDPNLGCRGRG